MATLHHEVYGPAGAPVVVLGGSLGTDLSMWRPQVAALSRRYRVICFDHRGHGGSQVPPGPYTVDDLGNDVLALLDGLGLPRVSYCGLSLGGMVGMWLAAHHPERVARLALLCTAAHLPPAAGWHERAALVRADGTASIANAVLGRWFTAGFLADPARRPLLDRYRRMLSATPAEGYAGCCEAIAALDLRPALPRICASTLVVAGADDPAIPPPLGAEIAAAVPGARFTVQSRAAHLASVERPDEVSALLTEHLRETG